MSARAVIVCSTCDAESEGLDVCAYCGGELWIERKGRRARPARPSHAARLESSPRLRLLLSALLKAGERGLTTREIFEATGSMAVHSDVFELRENGYRIECRSESHTPVALAGKPPLGPPPSSRRRFRYTLLGKLAEPSTVLSKNEAEGQAPCLIGKG